MPLRPQVLPEQRERGEQWKGFAGEIRHEVRNEADLVKKHIEEKSSSNKVQFANELQLSPRSGTLLPGRKQNVAVEFTPVDEIVAMIDAKSFRSRCIYQLQAPTTRSDPADRAPPLWSKVDDGCGLYADQVSCT